MKIVVDRNRCTGMGQCEALAPDIFEVTDAGQVDVLVDAVPEGSGELVEQAVAACPTEALSTES